MSASCHSAAADPDVRQRFQVASWLGLRIVLLIVSLMWAILLLVARSGAEEVMRRCAHVGHEQIRADTPDAGRGDPGAGGGALGLLLALEDSRFSRPAAQTMRSEFDSVALDSAMLVVAGLLGPPFRSLKQFNFFISPCGPLFPKARAIFLSFVKRPLETPSAMDIIRYFRVRKLWISREFAALKTEDIEFLNEATLRFASARVQELYKSWEIGELPDARLALLFSYFQPPTTGWF